MKFVGNYCLENLINITALAIYLYDMSQLYLPMITYCNLLLKLPAGALVITCQAVGTLQFF